VERANINLSQTVWWVERDSLLIAYYDAGTGKFTNHTDTTKLVSLLYIQRPDKYLIPGETPERDGFAASDTYLGITLSNASPPLIEEDKYLAQECEIPEQFHEALLNRVIANGYERKVETIPLAQHFHKKYEDGVRKGRAYSYKGRDGSKISITPSDF
jgi:hypothetical protein